MAEKKTMEFYNNPVFISEQSKTTNILSEVDDLLECFGK